MYTSFSFFFFNDPAPTEIYTLSLHDALPISSSAPAMACPWPSTAIASTSSFATTATGPWKKNCKAPNTPPTLARCSGLRSEEHTSELQSRLHLVCRLLLEKKKKIQSSMYCHT